MTEKQPLDRIDNALVALLQKDARRSNKELAAEVGLAPSSCLARVRRLRSDGVLRGFHAEVDLQALGVGLQCMISVQMAVQTREAYEALQHHLRAMPEMVALYNVAGQDDFLIHVAVRDTPHLNEVVVDGLTSRPEVAHVSTSLIFEYERRTVLPSFNPG